MEAQAVREMAGEGIPSGSVRLERSLDMRYRGQSYEIAVPYGDGFEAAFHGLHRRLYGYADEARETEVVTVRVRAVGEAAKPEFPEAPEGGADPGDAFAGTRPLVEDGTERAARIYRREALRPGNRLAGPAVIVEYSSTVYVPSGWACRVDGRENLVLSPAGS